MRPRSRLVGSAFAFCQGARYPAAMKRAFLPSVVLTVAMASACGGKQPTTETHTQNPPAPDAPPPGSAIPTNPPAPDGSPGIGDGAGHVPDGDGDGGPSMPSNPPPPEESEPPPQG